MRSKEEGGLGIRCAKKLNKALLKLWWKLLKLENNLAARVLKDKYFRPNNTFRAFSTGSHLWRGMGKACNLFKDILRWGIGVVPLFLLGMTIGMGLALLDLSFMAL